MIISASCISPVLEKNDHQHRSLFSDKSVFISKSPFATFCLTVLLFFSSAYKVNAAIDSWSNLGLEASSVSSLVIDPVAPSTLYAGTLTSGIYKSTDGGSNWGFASTGLSRDTKVWTLAVDPTTPTTLYAATSPLGVFKSINSGRSWFRVNTGLTTYYVFALAVDPVTPTTLYVGTDAYRGGVFKSTDSGANWYAVNNGLNVRGIKTLVIDPVTPTTLYVASFSSGGVHRSTDGGDNWAAVNAGLPSLSIRDLVIDPVTPDTLYAVINGYGVYKSINGGDNWAAMATGLTSLHAEALVIETTTPTTLYLGTTDKGIFKSINGGFSWVSFNNGLTDLSVMSLAIDPMTPTLLYAGTKTDAVFSFRYDITPDGLVFTDLTDIALNTLVTSDTLNINGISADIDISITGGEYSLNGETFTSAIGRASNGDTIQLRTTSSVNYFTTNDVILNAGGGGDTFSVTTLVDTVPDMFRFTDLVDVTPSILINSDAISITGLGASTVISVRDGEYSINGGAFTTADGFINNNDSVVVRHTSSSRYVTTIDTVLTIGGVSDTFSTTTMHARLHARCSCFYQPERCLAKHDSNFQHNNCGQNHRISGISGVR